MLSQGWQQARSSCRFSVVSCTVAVIAAGGIWTRDQKRAFSRQARQARQGRREIGRHTGTEEWIISAATHCPAVLCASVRARLCVTHGIRGERSLAKALRAQREAQHTQRSWRSWREAASALHERRVTNGYSRALPQSHLRVLKNVTNATATTAIRPSSPK